MANWNQLKKIPEFVTRLNHHYNGNNVFNLPIIIREQFANFIERQPWDKLNEDNETYDIFGKQFISSFMKELKDKSELSDINTRNIYESYCQFLYRSYEQPFNFIKNLKDGYKFEAELLRSGIRNDSRNLNNSRYLQINHSIEECQARNEQIGEMVQKIIHSQEQTAIEFQRLKEIEEFIETKSNQVQLAIHVNNQKLEKKEIEKVIHDNLNYIASLFDSIINLLNDNCNQIDFFQENTLDYELKEWLRFQQLAGNGASMENNNLGLLQTWCEKLVECIYHNLHSINRTQHLLSTQFTNTNLVRIVDNLTSLHGKLTTLLIAISQKTFIIEKQPPQVMKTNTRFTSTVRLLVGVIANLHVQPPVVQVSIISEAQACNLVRNKDILTDTLLKECAGEIVNNHGPMEHNQMSNQLSLNLRNMQLKKIRRTEKKGTESVMDEKFSLLFVTKFKIFEGWHRAWALSLPVVAVVHGNQEPHAWATVTWDNAFAEKDRLPFVIPDKVIWSRVGDVLSTKFKNSINKGLNKDNLRFLGGKVFRNNNIADYDQIGLSWSLFSKEAIPDQNFTFWEWFYALFKLTKDHLSKLWHDSLITFITKKQAEELLIDRPPGTFLIRFSDSELGGITICFRDNEKINPYPVVHIQPFTSNDLKIKSMADRVHDIKQLTHLYPDTPKDAAFGKYYTQSQGSEIQSNGYVKPELVTQIRLIPINSFTNESTNKSSTNDFSMHEFSIHQFNNNNLHENETLSNGNFANLNEFKFSTSSSTNDSVPNNSIDCPEIFFSSINDEDLTDFESKFDPSLN